MAGPKYVAKSGKTAAIGLNLGQANPWLTPQDCILSLINNDLKFYQQKSKCFKFPQSGQSRATFEGLYMFMPRTKRGPEQRPG